MIYIKLYEKFNKNHIEELCEDYNISDYRINSDGSIDVNDGVDISTRDLKKIPFIFNKVKGYFYCENNELNSLTGSPKELEGNFDCSDNKLISLVGGPKSIIGDFNCSENKIVSLVGGPGIMTGHYNFENNLVKDLKGFPKKFDFDYGIHCQNNPIENILELVKNDYWDRFIKYLIEYNVINGNKIFEEGLVKSYKMTTHQDINFISRKIKGYQFI